jgi:hypothetical protein
LAPNRSGKTTFFEGITLFSTFYSAVRGENASDYIIDGQDGYRELHLTHNGLTYVSKVYWLSKGGTKCYLTVTENGIETELNPNGNVQSYNEVLFIRFGLTKDHNRLLFLGPGLRDIISATPSERKTNISKFTPNIDIYLQLYKDTAKYFSKLKNDISVVVSELHRLGDDKDKIISMRDSSKEKYDARMESLQYLRTVEANSLKIINMLKVNGLPVTVSYDSSVTQFNELCKNLNAWNATFINACNDMRLTTSMSLSEYTSLLQTWRDSYVALKTTYDNSEKRAQELESSRSTLQSIIQQKEKDHDDYVNKNNPEKFLLQQNTLNDEISNITDSFNVLYNDIPELKEYENMFTLQESSSYLAMVDSITDQLTAMQSRYSENQVLEKYLFGNGSLQNFDTEKEALQTEHDKIANDIRSLQSDLNKFDQLKTLSDMLDSIPKSCTNDTCVFIQKAKEYVSTQKMHPELINKLENLLQDEINIKQKIENFDHYISMSMSLLKDIHIFMQYIDSKSELFSKFPDFELFKDFKTLYKNVVFLLPRARKFSEYAHLNDRFKELGTKLLEIKGMIDISKEYYDYIKKQEADLNNLHKQYTNLDNEIQHLSNTKSEMLIQITDYESKLASMTTLIQTRQNIVVGLQRYTALKDSITKLRKHYIAGKAFEDKIGRLRSKISFTQEEVSQYERELNLAEYNMRSFDEYEKKRDILTEEYGLLETLRKAWSPTTGIPLIFIEGFMNNLLSQANKYLAEIWPDQDLYIEGFDIDEKNFFINVRQEGSEKAHDASVCSGAERATLTTVLSLALLKQFPKIANMYNITKFDEIDSFLDYTSRIKFIGILNDLLDDIHCEQAFFISHSDTFQSDVDVVLLKDSYEYESRMLNGDYNVIYRQSS